MEKVGRNDACPCGSGKKFKRCCAERVEQEVAERKRTEMAVAEFREVDQRAEAVLGLIKAGRVDEAESAARQFTVEFPDETTAVERLGQVYEAQGQPQAAADEYRRGVAMMDARGDGHFCDCCRARMVKPIRRLDPDRPAPAPGRDPQ